MIRFARRHLLGAAAIALLALPVSAEVVHVDNAAFQELMKQGVKVVDIRTPGEWRQTGVVAGSRLVQFVDERGRVDPELFAQQLNAAVPADQPVILICRSGNRTGKAAEMLSAKQPKRKIYNVKDGLIGWNKAALPVIPLAQNLQQAGISCTPTC